jgi:hypothetical protein
MQSLSSSFWFSFFGISFVRCCSFSFLHCFWKYDDMEIERIFASFDSKFFEDGQDFFPPGNAGRRGVEWSQEHLPLGPVVHCALQALWLCVNAFDNS